jgi:penicillin-binding protein 1A
MLLARRIESVLTKQQILELYLNEIPLGRQSFGVQAAARAYFDKDVGDLSLHEAAFLAILPKAPENYSRARYADKALARRNWVLDQMQKNGWASAGDVAQAKAQPLGLVARRSENYTADAGYFLEEVRRQLIDRFGEQAKDGPNSVYAGGCGCVPRSTSSCRPPRRMPCARGSCAMARGGPGTGRSPIST